MRSSKDVLSEEICLSFSMNFDKLGSFSLSHLLSSERQIFPDFILTSSLCCLSNFASFLVICQVIFIIGQTWFGIWCQGHI